MIKKSLALSTTAPGECDAMNNYIEEVMAGTAAADKQIFISHVATDLACMNTRVNFFAERINEKVDTIDGLWYHIVMCAYLA